MEIVAADGRSAVVVERPRIGEARRRPWRRVWTCIPPLHTPHRPNAGSKCSESRSRCGRPRWDRGVGALSAFNMRAIRCCPTRDRGVHALVTSAQAARRESNHFPRKAGGQIDHGPIERQHPLAKRSARISLDSWCEQWRRREPSEMLGDGRERQRQSDQEYVQSYSLRPLAHPFQPFFFGLDTFSRALSRPAGRQTSADPTPRAGRVTKMKDGRTPWRVRPSTTSI